MTDKKNAREGIKCIFNSQLIQLISEVAMMGAVISGIVGFYTQYESTFVDSITSVTVFFYIAEVLSIISFIVMMVGVTKAKKDSDGYKKVYKYIIASLLIQIIGYILVGATGLNFISTAALIISQVCVILMFKTIIDSNASLLREKKLDELADKGTLIWRLSLIVLIISIVIGIVEIILAFIGSEAVIMFANVAEIVEAFFQTVAYGCFMWFLYVTYKNI